MDIQALLMRLLFTGGFYFVSDLFIHSAIRSTFFKNPKRAVRIYWIINILIFLISSIGFLFVKYMDPEIARLNSYFMGIFVSLLFSKLIVALILFITEDVYRIPYSFYTYRKRKKAKTESGILINRRNFIAKSALIAGLLPFSGFLYGIFKGRFNFTVRSEEIFFDDLPSAFDGFTITQISDLHIGSWDKASKHKLEYLVELITDLKSEVLFFTGDIVNSNADEMDGWYDTFNTLTAPFGVYSILGNHDYGDYIKWKTEEDRDQNLHNVKNIHPLLGFKLLLNENTFIEKGGEKIHIIGVENWGKGDFPKIGDLTIASKGIESNAFKILLSHDPSHWRAKVLEEQYPPQLTLSGHTHGFQMGIETPAFRISPSQLVYKEWAGLYQNGKQHLYVNRGLGTVGYPGRIGIWPEITKITLRRKTS